MMVYELQTRFDARASFYGKAQVIEENSTKLLRSYNTDICKVLDNGIVYFYNFHTSQTTLRHIKEFLNQNVGYGFYCDDLVKANKKVAKSFKALVEYMQGKTLQANYNIVE